MLESSFFLIINTVILGLLTLTGGSILDWLAVWQADQPAGLISAAPIQDTFALFYAMILLIEAGLFVQLFLVIIRRTNYSTGEQEI